MLSALLSRFAATNPCAEHTFLGLKPWYHYLTVTNNNGSCDVAFNALGNGKNSDVLLVLLAIVADYSRHCSGRVCHLCRYQVHYEPRLAR
jgi:hypothetical protein